MILPSYSCQSISTDDILPYTSWDIRPFLDKTAIPFQLESVGRISHLLQPPLVILCDGKFEFITGWRHFNNFYQQKTLTTLLCRVLPANLSTDNILAYLYLDYFSMKEPTVIELAWFLRLCKTKISSESSFKDLLSYLNLKSNRIFLDRLEQLLNLTDEMQRDIMIGKLNENIARELLKLNPEDLSEIYKVFTALGLGTSKQRKILQLLRDISGRTGRAYSTILFENEPKSILEHISMNTPQKSQSLMQYLQKLATPSLTQENERFCEWKDSLNLPQNQIIEHSPNFEQDTIKVSIYFSGKQAVEKALPELKALCNFSSKQCTG